MLSDAIITYLEKELEIGEGGREREREIEREEQRVCRMKEKASFTFHVFYYWLMLERRLNICYQLSLFLS